MIINRKSYLRKTFIIFIIFNIIVLGAKPRVYAADAAVPIIPIAEAILAYIVASGSAVASSDTFGKVDNFGKITNYDKEVQTVALTWAKVASNEIKMAAYDAWNAAYTTGTMINVPQSVQDWILSSTGVNSKALRMASIASVDAFEAQSGWIVNHNFVDSAESRWQFVSSEDGDYVFRFMTPQAKNLVYADTIYAGYFWTGSIYLYYSQAITGNKTGVNINIGDATWFPPGTNYDSHDLHKSITSAQAIIFLVEQLGAIQRVKSADVKRIYASETALNAAVPRAIPAPMAKDFIVQGEGDQAKPVGFPIPTKTTVKDKTTGIETDVVSVPIGDTLVDVKTGEVVGDVTTTPVNPPLDWNSQPSERINWEPLKLGNVLTKKFPFSIPWDIGNQFAVFDVSPKPPVLKVDKIIPVFNTSMKFKFTIDFTIWDPVFVVVRWGLIVAFDLGMILSIRKFMPE